MRLLQLATGPDQLIDLHPNVTVVSGLEPAARRMLVSTVIELATGTAPAAKGLLEAHGVMFELSDDMLALLDVAAGDLQPVVVASDLPLARQDPRVRERAGAERALAEVEERWFTATEDDRRVQTALAAASEALEHARRNEAEADAGAAERIRLIDELTAELDQAGERRRQLVEQRAVQAPAAEAAVARRIEVEAATVDVRTRHQAAAILCSDLAGQLDQARLSLDLGAVEVAGAAAAELARVQEEVAAERAAEEDVADGTQEDREPPAEWLARVQESIEALEKRLAAFGQAEGHEVADAYERLRARLDGELVPSPEAEGLADRLAALDGDLAATSGVGTTSGGLAEARTRLDEARHALLEAEQAARNPELDRTLVERLEGAHADLLDATDKADGRFAGARTQRRVDGARAAEHHALDVLGFSSYSDYMMGYSLLNVDPDKEAALDAARTELSAAEDAWRILEAETDAELARAERMERRRLLLEDARVLLGKKVRAGGAVAALRAVRIPADIPPDLVSSLQRSLDDVGVAVADEDLAREELMILAAAWLAEAGESTAREHELREELASRAGERLDALAAVEAEAQRAAQDADGSREEHREVRLAAAAAAVHVASTREEAHAEAEAAVATATAELDAAAEEERVAAAAAADAQAAVAEAVEETERLTADLRSIEEELVTLDRTEADAKEHLQSLTDRETAAPEDLAREVADTERSFAEVDSRAQISTTLVQELLVERQAAEAAVGSFHDAPSVADDSSIAEEVEWYLLARLAAQRAVSLGGSLPLLLDDALGGLDEDQLGHVLGRLERMADAVQVIVISDDPMASSWALVAGQDRAAVVRPQPV